MQSAQLTRKTGSNDIFELRIRKIKCEPAVTLSNPCTSSSVLLALMLLLRTVHCP